MKFKDSSKDPLKAGKGVCSLRENVLKGLDRDEKMDDWVDSVERKLGAGDVIIEVLFLQ